MDAVDMRERDGASARGFWLEMLGVLAAQCWWPAWLGPWIHRLRGVRIHDPWRTRITAGVLIENRYPELVEIEEGVTLTRGVAIVAHFTPTAVQRPAMGGVRFGKVLVRRGAYVGVNAVVLPGVTIGEGALVGAGAVVTRDVPDWCVAVGNPARLLRKIGEPGRGPAT